RGEAARPARPAGRPQCLRSSLRPARARRSRRRVQDGRQPARLRRHAVRRVRQAARPASRAARRRRQARRYRARRRRIRPRIRARGPASRQEAEQGRPARPLPLPQLRTVAIEPTFESWQSAARTLLTDDVSPADVTWTEGAAAMAGAQPGAIRVPDQALPPAVRVPRQFLDVARQAAACSDPARWSALYAVLWRLVHERRDLLAQAHDRDDRRVFALVARARREVERVEQEQGRKLESEGGGGLDTLKEAASRWEGCDLFRHATQMVFGRGPADARVVLVGEQPGDQEDLRGAPFVGPAGEVFDRALVEAGLDREKLYVTNAVKHFKFVMRGKRRIHQTPRLTEVAACRPWVEAELQAIKPESLVCLGATAARSLLGVDFRLMRDRGRIFATPWAPRTV